MKMKYSMMALLLVAGTAFADFGGNWAGTVQLSFAGMGSFTCPAVTFKIIQTPTLLTLSQSGATCSNGMVLNASSNSLQIQGNTVVLNNQPVGTITDTSLTAHVSSQGQTMDITFTRQGDSLTITENATSAQGSLGLKADLKKQ